MIMCCIKCCSAKERRKSKVLIKSCREDSFIDFVRRNVSGMFRGLQVLLLDVSVKVEFIDFIQPRIKQNCEKISKLHLKNM